MTAKPLSDEQLRALPEHKLRTISVAVAIRNLYDMPATPRKRNLGRNQESDFGEAGASGCRPGSQEPCPSMAGGPAMMVDVREYEPDIYRLHIGFPVSYSRYLCGMNRLSELSFIEADLPHFTGDDLAGFLAQLCVGKAEHFNWELFSHDRSYPGYAWTKAANAFYDGAPQGTVAVRA